MIYFADSERRLYYAFFNDSVDKEVLLEHLKRYKEYYADVKVYKDDEPYDIEKEEVQSKKKPEK